MFSSVLVVYAEPDKTIVSGDFTYELNDSAAWYSYTLTEYNGTGGEITIPAEVNGYPILTIADAYKDNTTITSVVVSDGVEVIGDYAFFGCTALNDIKLPDSIHIINDFAFFGCTGLTKINLSENVGLAFGESSFEGCTNLTKVTTSGEFFYDEVIGDNSGRGNAFKDCVNLREITIPDGIQYISDNDFSGCTALEKVYIGYNTADISDTAFDNTSFQIIAPPSSYSISYAQENGIAYTSAPYMIKLIIIIGLIIIFITAVILIIRFIVKRKKSKKA